MKQRDPFTRYFLFPGRADVIRPYRRGDAGFTLMELIITIAILAILLVAATLVINPIERIAEANDSKRQQDLSGISDAIEFTQASGTRKEFGGIDPDGALTNRCTGESNQTVFVSVLGTDASGTCDSPPDDLPSGWTYRCAPDDGPGDIDGTGWLPVDLTAGGAIQSAISNMPRDSESTFSTGYFYSYVCDRRGDFELAARMVSDRFSAGGDKDLETTDSGDSDELYEVGSDLTLVPAPFVFSTILLADDFTGTNGDSWNVANWTVTEVSGGDADIQSNEGHLEHTGSGNSHVHAVSTISSIQSSEILVKARMPVDYTRGELQISLRHDGTLTGSSAPVPTDAYTIRRDTDGNDMELYRYVGGVGTILDSFTGPDRTVDFWIRFQVAGTQARARVWLDGGMEPSTWDLVGNDSTHTTGVASMLYAREGGSGNAYIDDVTVSGP